MLSFYRSGLEERRSADFGANCKKECKTRIVEIRVCDLQLKNEVVSLKSGVMRMKENEPMPRAGTHKLHTCHKRAATETALPSSSLAQ